MIWMNQEAKFQGLSKELHQQLLATPIILVVAHFPRTLARLREEFGRHNLAHVVQGRRMYPADFLRATSPGNSPRIILVQADALVSDESPNPVIEELAPLPILVAERHFLRPNDETIVAFAASLGRPCRVSFSLSLNDSLMQAFAGEWVGEVLARLGMKESEPIESSMVARRIQGAQASFAKKVPNAKDANSAEEWLQLNLPGKA